MVPPVQVLLNKMVLLGKPAGGTRSIAIMNTIYRLTMKLCGQQIEEFDTTKAGFGDRALNGSSAFRAQVSRTLDIEINDHEGNEILT